MQSNHVSAQNLINSGRYPFQSFGPQTDRNYLLPNPTQPPLPVTGPNDTTMHIFSISMRSLTTYTGSQDDHYYLITLPTIIDRPKNIQVIGTTMSHLDSANTGFKTIYVSTPIVKQSGFHFINPNNSAVKKSDSLMGIVRIPYVDNLGTVFTIATTQVLFKAEIKEQGYAQIFQIPIQLLNNRGVAQELDEDIDLDGELIFQIECEKYNSPKRSMMNSHPVTHMSGSGSIGIGGMTKRKQT